MQAAALRSTEEVFALKVRIKFRKYGVMKFIGHLDVMRYFQKAMRRAEIPIAFSGGYSPHMIMSFANPLGVGITSDGEYFDIELTEPISSEEAVSRLNAVMVEGMEIVSFVEIDSSKKQTGMSIVAAADYLCTVKRGVFPEDWKCHADAFYAQDEINVLKQTKKSEKEVNIKPLIYRFTPRENGIYMQLATGSAENLKPGLVMEAFASYLHMEKDLDFSYHRLEVYADTGENGAHRFVSLESLGKAIEAS